MPRVIELLDKKLKPCSIDRILNIYSNGTWGCEAVQYFRDVIEEIEDSYNGQIDELTVQNEDLREKLENIREVCRE